MKPKRGLRQSPQTISGSKLPLCQSFTAEWMKQCTTTRIFFGGSWPSSPETQCRGFWHALLRYVRYVPRPCFAVGCNVPAAMIKTGGVPAPNIGGLFIPSELALFDSQACRLDNILTRFRSCSNPRRANSGLLCQTCQQVLQSTGRTSSILQSPDQPCQASKCDPVSSSPSR